MKKLKLDNSNTAESQKGLVKGQDIDNLFIVKLWTRVFRWLLDRQPLFYIACKLLRWNFSSPRSVESWVILCNLFALLSLIFLTVCQSIEFWNIRWVIVVFGVLRIIEVITVQVNNVFLSEGRPIHQGYRRLAILAVHNYLEILIWFAAFYLTFANHFLPKILGIIMALYFSTITMTTLGYGDIKPQDSIGMALTGSQALIGIFLTVAVFAQLISLIKPRTRKKKKQDQKEEVL